MSEVSEEQLKANRENAKKGGVKTEGGKEVSKYNAIKHNLLTHLLSREEAKHAKYFKARLHQQFNPDNPIEELLVERIAVWYVRLRRAIKVEGEHIRRIKDPESSVLNAKTLLALYDLSNDNGNENSHKEYKPEIEKTDVQDLTDIYLRYETEIERNLHRSIIILQKIQEIRKRGWL